MGIDYQKDLNESQWEAVRCLDAPELVIAGAGSGKTRVLTYKIAYLLDQGQLPPSSILALTFTNKAANEMKGRVEQLVGIDRARGLWMGTFHSVFARILREEVESLPGGYTHDYTIYDAQDSQALIRQIIRELGLDEKRYRPNIVARYISEAKNNLLSPDDYAMSLARKERDRAANMGETANIYAIYDARLRTANAMDFDDLLLNTFRLFENQPEIRRKYEDRFAYVLVDEYQDTNRVQHRIVVQLTEHRQRVCIVGDDAQSIYSFRGAVVDNILSFQTLYPGTRLFKLERNYRSTQTIVRAANALIAHNERQIHKDVYSRQAEGEPIEVTEAYSDREEVAMVARKIEWLRRREAYAWGDFVVLYRTNSQSRAFEEDFRKRGFPYRIVGGMSFYQRKEVKDAVAYLRLAVNLHDEAALWRIINVPARGIGDTTRERVERQAAAFGVAAWEVVEAPARYGLEVNDGIRRRLEVFASMIREGHEMAETTDAHEAALHLLHSSGLWAEVFARREMEDIARQQNLQELVDGIASFVAERSEEGMETSLVSYLQTISLLSDADEEGTDDRGEDRVTLMTMHQAKGLEFRAVFVVGLEERLFPSEMAIESHGGVEEERRLFYVAMTRAEERLFLTWSHSRMRFGRFENNERSRFLAEIGVKNEGAPRSPSLASSRSSALSRYGQGSRSPSRPSYGQGSPSRPPSEEGSLSLGLSVGDRVEHARFGQGVINEFEDSGLDIKAVVRFDNFGVKRLLLRFARLTKLDQ